MTNAMLARDEGLSRALPTPPHGLGLSLLADSVGGGPRVRGSHADGGRGLPSGLPAAHVQGVAPRATEALGTPRVFPTSATYNCGPASDGRLADDLGFMAYMGVQVICLQEASDRRRALKAFRKAHPSWRIYRARLRLGGKATPILWDASAVEVLRKRAPLAVGRRWVGPKGAGPTYSKTKRVLEVDARLLVQLRTTDGRSPVARYANTHLIPSAGRTDLGPAEEAARRAHYREHRGVLLHQAAASPHPFILHADLNATPDSLLVRDLRKAGFVGWHDSPTEGDRAIDQILGYGHLLPVGGATVLRHLSSDHAAVVRRWFKPRRLLED